MSSPTPIPVVLAELDAQSGMRIGVATLNSERSLNALSLDMIRLLDPQLQKWAADPRIACIVLRGAGEKSFCAGGDVRSVREAIIAWRGQPGPNPQAQAFFAEEYRLDYRIHTYPKPILVWGSGIVMGGGLGLLVGASHRVVTETSRIAMPEINIGLFPDVAGSWFLPRMPGRTGLFSALTAAPLNGADALFSGLAEYFLHAADYDMLVQRLTATPWTSDATTNHIALSKLLRQFADRANAAKPISNLRTLADEIERLTDGDTLAEVVASITSYGGGNAWLKQAATTLAKGSPTSAALIWELLRRAKHMSLAEVFQLDLVVALQCCARLDFAEGVRAVLVDKDHKPQWTPASIGEVSEKWIMEHFANPWSEGDNPLASLG